MEALSRDLHPETREGPGAALVLSTQKSVRHAGKLCERILLTRILYEVGGRGLLGDEQFGFRLKHAYS